MEALLRNPLAACTLFSIFIIASARPVRAAESVPIIGAGGACAGWSVVETANFRVLHRHDLGLARRVAVVAENTRAAMYSKWFGHPVADWSPRCEVVLYERGLDYAQGTGLSAGLPGYSSIQAEAGRVVGRHIDINGDAEDWLCTVLPHEVTHVVLWSEFGRGGLPRWAHEGIAVLSEPRARIEQHLRNLPAHRYGGELFPVSELVGLTGYPERHRFGPFYAQSVSLVEFLAGRKSAEVFIRFLRDGRRHGYEAALRRHYAWSLAELEEHWGRCTFGAERAQPALYVTP
jgi:hypothetical protein